MTFYYWFGARIQLLPVWRIIFLLIICYSTKNLKIKCYLTVFWVCMKIFWVLFCLSEGLMFGMSEVHLKSLSSFQRWPTIRTKQNTCIGFVYKHADRHKDSENLHIMLTFWMKSSRCVYVCIYIYMYTLLLYIAVNTAVLEYNTNATCFDLQQSSSG